MEIIEKITNHNIFSVIDQYASIIVLTHRGEIVEYIYSIDAVLFLNSINSECVDNIHMESKDMCGRKHLYKHFYIINYIDELFIRQSVYNNNKKCCIKLNNNNSFHFVYEYGPLEVHPDIELYINTYKPMNYSIKIITMKQMMASKIPPQWRIPLHGLKNDF